MSVEYHHPFELGIAAAWPPADWCDVHVVLAVSGGPDSVAMLRAVDTLKSRLGGRGRLFVAHLNHGLRGVDAAADQAWLGALCDRLWLPLHVHTVDVASLAADQGDSWEAAARTARYDFLLRTAEQVGARWVAVAHTRDDQVETIVHRLIRGTGLAGLAGMQRVRPLSPTAALIRPLLEIRRVDVIEYIGSLGQDFRTDVTNADVRFTRNRLRHELLPLLRSEFNADFDAAIVRLAEQAAETQRVIEGIAAELAESCVEFDWPATVECSAEGGPNGKKPILADRICIDCRSLSGRPPLVLREVCRAAWRAANWPLQAMGFDQWQQLATLVASDGKQPQINLPGNVHAAFQAGVLLLHCPSYG